MDRAQRHFDAWIRILLGAIVVVLIFLCVLLFREYQNLRAQELAGVHMPGLSALRGRAAMPLSDVNFIQSWMTYDYVSHIYALPPDYLKTTLDIADTRYPRVSIAESAEAQKTTAAALTAEVKTAVSDYLSQDNSKNGT